MNTPRIRRGWTRAATLAVAGCVGLLAGCQAGYSADIRNKTPQPLYAQVVDISTNPSVVRGSTRIPPGSRGGLGPYMIVVGKAILVVDTLPNPSTPRQIPMGEGTTTVEVQQLGDNAAGELDVRLIGR